MEWETKKNSVDDKACGVLAVALAMLMWASMGSLAFQAPIGGATARAAVQGSSLAAMASPSKEPGTSRQKPKEIALGKSE